MDVRSEVVFFVVPDLPDFPATRADAPGVDVAVLLLGPSFMVGDVGSVSAANSTCSITSAASIKM